jgi:SAM-dependent methyltransferase
MTVHAHESSTYSMVVTKSGGVIVQCPCCAGKIGTLKDGLSEKCSVRVCPDCSWGLQSEQGIWKTLLPGRAAHFSKFIMEYESIREAEGRGSADSAFYLSLPYCDVTARNQSQWKIRARSFDYIERRILPKYFAKRTKELRILDLGAGNCWMSYRLALRGHFPVAVDLLVNDRDGLGAAWHYRKRLPSLFPRFQAELGRLPFAHGQFDLTVFNASFHYSEDYEQTLSEALRCTRVGGVIVIADTPWYSCEESGEQMIRERKAAFAARYGTASDSINSLEYLTDSRLRRLERICGIQWQVDSPYYGFQWSLRPYVAALNQRREPSQFRVFSARRPQ